VGKFINQLELAMARSRRSSITCGEPILLIQV
jgi:hypothetical protein